MLSQQRVVQVVGHSKRLPDTYILYITFTFFTFRAFGRRFYPKRLTKRVHLLKERQQYISVVPEDKNRAV